MTVRDRTDRCPGVLRPWIADDGALVRLRVPGGELSAETLNWLLEIAREFGDGTVQLTKRANLQVRGIAHADGCVDADFVEAITEAGLLPHPTHELIRNVMVSPLTGRIDGRADLRPVARALDVALVADPQLAALPGRFLFVLDDGRGDVADRPLDLGLVAVDATHAQVRAGADHWGPVVRLDDAPATIVDLARGFLAERETQWHVDELGVPLVDEPRQAAWEPSAEPAFGPLSDTLVHVAVPDGVLTEPVQADTVLVTPWRSLVLETA